MITTININIIILVYFNFENYYYLRIDFILFHKKFKEYKMKTLRRFMVIDDFEEGWGIDKYADYDLLYEYCIDALFVPEENIDELSMNGESMEIVFKELLMDDLSEDWFTNLKKMAIDYGDA